MPTSADKNAATSPLLLLAPGLGLAAGIALCPCCLVGLPAILYSLSALCVTTLRIVKPRDPAIATALRGQEVRAGFLFSLSLAIYFALPAACVSGALLPGAGGVAAGPRFGYAIATELLLGAVLCPLFFAPLYAVEGEGVVGSCVRSFALSARIGMPRLLGLGLRAAGALAASLAVSAWVGAQIGAALGWVVHAILLAAALVYGTFATARVYVRERAHAAETKGAVADGADVDSAVADGADADSDKANIEKTNEVDPSARYLSRLLWLAAPAAAALCTALAVAAFTPTAMKPAPPQPRFRRGLRPPAPVVAGRPQRLPGTSIEVRVHEAGLEVSAADGGGSGDISAPFAARPRPLRAYAEPFQADGADGFALYLTDGRAWAMTRIDREGVRLDDALTDRVAGRLGAWGLSLLAIVIVALSAWLWVLSLAIGRARQLAAPLGEAPSRSHPLRALEVMARTEATLRRGRRGRRRTPAEDLHLRSLDGAYHLRIPAGQPIKADPELEEISPKTRLTAISRFDDLEPTGLRDAPAPWPPDARLIAGDLDTARAAMRRRGLRASTALFGLAILGTLGVIGVLTLRL